MYDPKERHTTYQDPITVTFRVTGYPGLELIRPDADAWFRFRAFGLVEGRMRAGTTAFIAEVGTRVSVGPEGDCNHELVVTDDPSAGVHIRIPGLQIETTGLAISEAIRTHNMEVFPYVQDPERDPFSL